MANKPYTVKLGTGQCTFVYMHQEQAEKYGQALLNLYNADNGIALDAQETTFGLYHNKEANKYELVTIKFNPLTKAAQIEKIEPVAEKKNWALVALERAFQKIGVM